MASNPYPQKRKGELTGKWVMKWRPDPVAGWAVIVLGDDPQLKSKPAKKPPQFVVDRHREFSDKEYKAKNGIAAPSVRAKGLDGYLADYSETFRTGHKAGSVRQLDRHVKSFLAFASTQKIASVQAVTRAHCRDYVTLRRATVSSDTMRTEVGYLSPVWTQAVDDGLMAANPWVRIKIAGKSTRKTGTAWTTGEVARIAAAACRFWQSELVLVLANTGLRISTALEMPWDWIHWREGEHGAIRIPPDQAAETDGVKTAYTHLLSSGAHDILFKRKALAGDSRLVFPNPITRKKGEVVPYDSARDAVQRAIAASKVPAGTPHDLRRTYGTLLYKSCRNLDFVRRQLGHTSIVTTQRYLGVIETDDSAMLDGFSIGVTHPGGSETSPRGATPAP